MPRRLLHLDNATVLWLDRRNLQLPSIELAISSHLAMPQQVLMSLVRCVVNSRA